MYIHLRTDAWERFENMTSAADWMDHLSVVLDNLRSTQMEHIETASVWSAEVIAAGGLVHLFGSGHSRIPVEEMFPRYGSYPGFHPMVELSMTFHTSVVGSNSQPAAMFIERTEGLAEVVLDGYRLQSGGVIFVFSVSGRSAVPVEMAAGARARGLRVVGVTSVAESMAMPATSQHGRLLDNSDLVIDLGTPPGDGLVEVGASNPIGPASTVASVTVANMIKVRTAELLADKGALPPVITAASVVGPEESETLFASAYSEYSDRIAGYLKRGET